MGRILDAIVRGVSFVRTNPQIVYTIFLLILIPVAFVLNGQQFLNAARENQERLEKDRIGLMHDTFVTFASGYLEERGTLQKYIADIAEKNPALTELKIAHLESPAPLVIASRDTTQLGTADSSYTPMYEAVGLNTRASLIFETYDDGIRYWKAFRGIKDPQGKITAVLMTATSMAQIDDLAARNIRNAYVFLVIIIVAIFILLLRHARIIDYATLYRRLKEIDLMKDSFVAMASHELRTPLTAMKWQLETMEEDAKNQKGLTTLKASADQLGRLVEDILDVSRIEQGRMKFEMQNIDISTLISETVKNLEPLAKEKNLTINHSSQTLPHISIDSARLIQVLTNLIGNAIKYTIQGSITIETSSEQKELIIRIRDTGIGVSAEDQKKLFQKFERIKSEETRKINGTGLGLWITKYIVEQMHGSITVESIRNVGSSFIVSFPVVTE
ncbi:MAG: HAMP domain-containing sensor histidine kinase [Patescibacteria group bacterium]